MELWKIVLGLFTAAFLIHFRGAYLRAQRQQGVALRLRSYLLHWRSWFLENDVFLVFHLGAEWNKEVRNLIAKGEGAESLVKLKDEKRKMIADMKEAIEKGGHNIDIDKVRERVQRLPQFTADEILNYSQRFEQNLLDGKTFVSDEDACALGPYFGQACVRLKMNLISVNSKFAVQFMLLLADPKNFALKESAEELSEMIWKGVLVAKDIDDLSKRVESIADQSVLTLTWKNLQL